MKYFKPVLDDSEDDDAPDFMDTAVWIVINEDRERLIERYSLRFLELNGVIIENRIDEDMKNRLLYFERFGNVNVVMILFTVCNFLMMVITLIAVLLVIVLTAIIIMLTASILLCVIYHGFYIGILVCDSKPTASFCPYTNYTASNCSERHDPFYQTLGDVFRDILYSNRTKDVNPHIFTDMAHNLVDAIQTSSYVPRNYHVETILILGVFLPMYELASFFDELAPCIDLMSGVNNKILHQCGLMTKIQ